MRRFEIFLTPTESSSAPPQNEPHSHTQSIATRAEAGEPAALRDVAPTSAHVGRERRRPAREVLDVFIGGANVTARVAGTQASCVLRDLGLALADLAQRTRGKAIVRFYDDPWEMCVERFDGAAALSVYRAGPEPFVQVHERIVPFREVIESTRDAIEVVLRSRTPPRPVGFELEAAAAALRAVPADEAVFAPPPAPAPVAIEIERDAPISFAAEFALRAGEATEEDPSVERADLHALLFRGKLRAEIRGRALELPEGHPFLFAERLLDMSRRALDAWERGLAHHVRAKAGGVLVGLRLSHDGQLALSLGAKDERLPASTFPALGVPDVVEAALAFGRSLVRAILRRDRSQCTNLRLSAFRRQLREASEALREVCRSDAKINPSPESYRAFVEHTTGAPRSAQASGPRAIDAHEPASLRAPSTLRSPRAFDHTRMRYASRWRALVPGIDLRATFLCGDRLVVGAAQETFCLDRASGAVIWRAATERATSVVTPGGIARLAPDGSLSVHDFGNGEVTLRAKLAPRVGGPVSGVVVHGAGLPRLLVVTEGEEHLVAIDLTSGEPRWRFTWGKKGSRGKYGALRLKRAGKLVYFTCGDSAIAALDVLTGAIVWRARDRLRFRSPPTFDHDALFAVAGGVSCPAQLHGIDPFSGHVRWSASIPQSQSPGTCTVEGSPLAAGRAIAVCVRERSALRLVAHDRDTGAPMWTSRAPVAPVGTSWLAVDDLFLGNTPTGEVVAIEAETGELRYRRILGPRALEADLPRRLEPVLRSGALFAPHVDVHVLRPRDGEIIATIAPCEAIPDLLRVDERCDVYVAESGHLVSFSALPKLSLVKS